MSMTTKEQLDHHANIQNPNNLEYKKNMDNRADQLNPNNHKYWKARELEKPSSPPPPQTPAVPSEGGK